MGLKEDSKKALAEKIADRIIKESQNGSFRFEISEDYVDYSEDLDDLIKEIVRDEDLKIDLGVASWK